MSKMGHAEENPSVDFGHTFPSRHALSKEMDANGCNSTSVEVL